MKEKIQTKVREIWNDLPSGERAVLWCICEAYDKGQSVTQAQISNHEQYLGHHDIHESHLGGSKESTLRKIRQLVRNLRLDYKLPILSSGKGYRFPHDQRELDLFVEELDRKAKAQAAAWFETYSAMREHTNATSSFLDSMEVV